MVSLKKYSGTFYIFLKNQTLTKFQYRGTLWADILFFIFGYGTQFYLIFLLVGKFGTLGGWTQYEVMLLYSMSILSYTIACTFLMGLYNRTPEKIRNGEFDQTLTKPMNPLIYEVISSFSAYYTIHVILGIVMVCVSFGLLNVTLSIGNMFFLILVVIGGAMIQGGVLVLFSSASFFLIGDNPLVYSVFVTLRLLNENPISIYPPFAQIFLTVIMPFAFVSFYPAQYFLGKNDFLMFHPMLQYLTPLVGLLVLLAAAALWLCGIKQYKSSGN